MYYDWYSCYSDKEVAEAEIKNLVTNCYSKMKLFHSLCDSTKEKKYLKELISGTTKEYTMFIEASLNQLGKLSLQIPKIKLALYPLFTFFLQFKFTLATPFISSDDEEFYICENPVKKDKVFKVPMVSGSSWKGNLRWTMRKISGLNDNESDSQEIIGLLGNERAEETNFSKGRLTFFSTFFNKISLEVINPHDRKTKSGTQPIYIESVPEDTEGEFSLFYVPFDLTGKPESDGKKIIARDLELICCGIKEMMLTYGFSAKKSSGFGIAKDELKDIQCQMNGIEKTKEKQKSPRKPRISNLREIGILFQNKFTFSDLEKDFKSIIDNLKKTKVSGEK